MDGSLQGLIFYRSLDWGLSLTKRMASSEKARNRKETTRRKYMASIHTSEYHVHPSRPNCCKYHAESGANDRLQVQIASMHSRRLHIAMLTLLCRVCTVEVLKLYKVVCRGRGVGDITILYL